MKLRLFCLSLLLVFSLNSFAANGQKYSYMRIAVLGNLTDPVMIITDETGKQEQVSILPTLTLNKEKTMTNISENEEALVAKINELGKKGWELFSIATTGTQTYYT